MERVTFLVADTGSRISCLLNPEKLVRRRLAGLRTAVSGSGVLAGPAASDDVLISTGGGRTELDLELLFDVELTPAQAAPAAAVDVRDLTKPLWDLAENGPTRTGPAAVRFCWGLWNVLCVVTAVAEQLERFDASGTPGRSWLTMRLVRVPDPNPAPVQALHATLDPGITDDGTAGGERLDELAARYYGAPWLWRLIAVANDLYDSPVAPAGRTLVIPEPPAR